MSGCLSGRWEEEDGLEKERQDYVRMVVRPCG